MEPDFENAASCRPRKPLKRMEYLLRRSGVGVELGASPWIMRMVVESCCSHRPVSTLITNMNVRFNSHANHAEGVQYAITSLVNGTERSSRKNRTFSARCKRASSRFLEASCFLRPVFFGSGLFAGGAWAAWVAKPVV